VTYSIRIGHANFTIIDTPGFGDTRGPKQDEVNFEKIKKSVLDAKGINCICVV
jgi:GTP-binding protein EngB required for normal cell division